MALLDRLFPGRKERVSREERVQAISGARELAAIAGILRSRRETTNSGDLRSIPSPYGMITPDPVVRRKGYSIYADKMPLDGILDSCLDIKTALAMPGSYVEAPPGPKGAEAAALVEDAFEHLPGSTLDLLQDELVRPTLRDGFSVSEVIWSIEKGSGRAWIEDVLRRDPRSIRFIANKQGRLVRIVQDYGLQASSEAVDFPAGRTLHLVFRGGRSNPFGRSIFLPAFDRWSDKVDWMIAYAIMLRRFGAGLLSATVPDEKYQNAREMSTLLEILDNAQRDTVSIWPDWAKIELKATATSAGDLYEKAIASLNTEMTRTILGPDTAIAEGLRVGGYADSAPKQELLITLSDIIGDKLREQITEQLIRPFVNWNLPGYPVPRLRSRPISKEETKELLGTWSEAAEKDMIRNPTAREQEELLKKLGIDIGELTAAELRTAISDARTKKNETLLVGKGSSSKKAPKGRTREDVLKIGELFAKREDAATAALVDAWKSAAGKSLDRLRRNLFPDGKLRKTVKNDSGKEVPVSPAWIRDSIQFAEKEKVADALLSHLMTSRDDGISWARSFVPATATPGIVTETMARALLRNRVYFMLEDRYNDIASKLWYELDLLIRGQITDETALSNVRNLLYNAGFDESRARTLVSTSLADAYEMGIETVFRPIESRDPMTTEEGAIIGYTLSPILDNLTCEECQTLEDLFFLVGDPDLFFPPLHYNCRCVALPVFAGESPWNATGDEESGHWLTDAERALVRQHPPLPGFGGASTMTVMSSGHGHGHDHKHGRRAE